MNSSAGKEFMRRLPLFEGLSEEDLERLYGMSSTISVKQGELLIREGSRADELYIIIDGELEVLKQQDGHEQMLAVRIPGEVVGEMALLEKRPRSASVRALKDSRLQVIDQRAFQTLLACSPGAALTILETVVARLTSSQSMLMQQQKLAALGTMAAGLAHELNNPAAAIGRSTSRLHDALATWGRATAELMALPHDSEQAQALADLQEEIGQRTAPLQLSALAYSELEEEVQAWLEAQGVEPAWEIAATLVTTGWTPQGLGELAERFDSAHLPAMLRWLAAALAAYTLLEEAHASADSISALVKAVKSYAYLDRAPVQEVDIHESLESTLVILRHRTKVGITLIREYADDLPRIEAYGSELNQVWTNIIDNAIEAMNGQGRLELRTYAKGDQVVVEIRDDGPGIPPEVQSRLFEPFFTTKPVGIGTGLGLHIAYNIVVQRHHGQIRVLSEPGFTCFQVILPQTLEPAARPPRE